LDVDDLLDSSKIDEQSVMTYLSLFPTKFNELGVIPGVISKSDEAAKKSKKSKSQNKKEEVNSQPVLSLQIPVEEDYEHENENENVSSPPLITILSDVASHSTTSKAPEVEVELESAPEVAEKPPIFDSPDEASRDGVGKAVRKKSSSKQEAIITTKATTLLVPLKKGSKMKVFSLKVIREMQKS